MAVPRVSIMSHERLKQKSCIDTQDWVENGTYMFVADYL